jgi:hypothetical protein
MGFASMSSVGPAPIPGYHKGGPWIRQAEIEEDRRSKDEGGAVSNDEETYLGTTAYRKDSSVRAITVLSF